ncbi:prepilin-type N-terminal cleavage/methylation domain-containing protein [Candidatus Uhrbacteria bacterium]|nr:prepilin-type N-terminal cleavage/methylation domain-containing protein [Candidatus Uhrbacteria bacterium]
MRRGFTLIEVLIYMAILGVMLLNIVELTSGTFDLRGRARASLTIEENLRFVLSRVVARIYDADGITAPATGTTSTLTLDMLDATENPTTITLSNGAVLLTEGTNAAIPLTSDEVTVTTLSFTRLSGTPPGVRIDITGELAAAAGVYQSVLSLSTTAVIRR